ncbi:OsmC family protein [Streptomyces sp. NBC_01210]|uniref:OsmC family protein n=1 Tax=Streptomyces sp. NBC_01210 TaxID=2903774 RepID=UPI002E0FE611|nr:OsmC family protein [Streptomyces sp. NBC_01210]
MSEKQRATQAEYVRTGCGRTISVSRFVPEGPPAEMGRVVLGTVCEPYDRSEVWASLTPEEARRVAGILLFQAEAVAPPEPGVPGHAEAVSISGDAYEVTVRGHVLTVDQPVADGGHDTAPTPVELLVAAATSCIAHYAGRFLDRHGIPRKGLRVAADYKMASARPARVGSLSISVDVPELPPARAGAFQAVISHCTVKNTLQVPPEITITLGDRSGTRPSGSQDSEDVDRVPADGVRDSGVTL